MVEMYNVVPGFFWLASQILFCIDIERLVCAPGSVGRFNWSTHCIMQLTLWGHGSGSCKCFRFGATMSRCCSQISRFVMEAILHCTPEAAISVSNHVWQGGTRCLGLGATIIFKRGVCEKSLGRETLSPFFSFRWRKGRFFLSWKGYWFFGGSFFSYVVFFFAVVLIFGSSLFWGCFLHF